MQLAHGLRQNSMRYHLLNCPLLPPKCTICRLPLEEKTHEGSTAALLTTGNLPLRQAFQTTQHLQILEEMVENFIVQYRDGTAHTKHAAIVTVVNIHCKRFSLHRLWSFESAQPCPCSLKHFLFSKSSSPYTRNWFCHFCASHDRTDD